MIDNAPKDRKVDLWAKSRLPKTDRFIFEQFPDCRFSSGDSMTNRGPS